jgi:tetratricopeptide (TPR) repeat protein
VTLFELARVAHLTGDEALAEKLYREVIARDQHGDDAMRRKMGDHLENLSVLLVGQGRYDESAAVSREALAEYRKYWPADYPQALMSEAQYGIILMHLHRPAEAEPVFRDVLARDVRVLGPEHADTLVAQTQLGESLIDLERYPEAVKILRATAESLDKVLGPEHRYSTGTWGDYARASCSGPDPAAGLAAAQRVADIRAKTLPAGDWHLAGAQTNIGFCLAHLHRYVEAETILRKAAADLEAVRGAGFYTTQFAYKALRDLYLATGRSAEAQAVAEKIQP